jgi:hypothetical protein
VKLLRTLPLAFLLLAGCTQVHTTPDTSTRTFYLAASGDDAHSGLSPTSPWKSLDRANRESFLPGDALLLKAGDTFHGQLHPQGSGTDESLSSLAGYQFRPDSPCIRTAIRLSTRGPRDFFGTPLRPDSASFGAHEPAP